MKIIRGTTPTIQYTFKIIAVSDIVKAYLSIEPDNIEKTIDEAEIGENSISWTLTQAETLAFGDEITVMANWLLSDGTRAATKKQTFIVEKNYKEGMI